MAKRHDILEHTADIGVTASADSLPELFEALAEGVAGIICDPAGVQPLELRRLTVEEEEDDLEGVLVDFLWQLVGVVLHERFVLRSVRALRVGPRGLEAELCGEPLDPARHELGNEVKAVTWHQLRVAEVEGSWQGRVILDL